MAFGDRKKTGFHTKQRKPLKCTPLKRGTSTLKRTKLRVVGHSTTAEIKREIQALLRQISIYRDGGCVFRNYPESGACGCRRKDGELILQFDHLHSRTHAISFSDSRLGICVCKRHHFYFKKQYPALYEKIAREVIGKKRCKLLDAVREDRRPYKVDLKLEKLALEQELKKYE